MSGDCTQFGGELKAAPGNQRARGVQRFNCLRGNRGVSRRIGSSVEMKVKKRLKTVMHCELAKKVPIERAGEQLRWSLLLIRAQLASGDGHEQIKLRTGTDVNHQSPT